MADSWDGSPRDWEINELLTAEKFDTELRDRMTWLFNRTMLNGGGGVGITNETIKTGIDNSVLPADFLTAATGWNNVDPVGDFLIAVQDSGAVWITYDGGANWQTVGPPGYTTEYFVEADVFSSSASYLDTFSTAPSVTAEKDHFYVNLYVSESSEAGSATALEGRRVVITKNGSPWNNMFPDMNLASGYLHYDGTNINGTSMTTSLVGRIDCEIGDVFTFQVKVRASGNGVRRRGSGWISR
jgi:hypothetical protein